MASRHVVPGRRWKFPGKVVVMLRGEAQEMSLKRTAVRDGDSGFPIKLLPDNPSIANTSAQGKPPVTILRT